MKALWILWLLGSTADGFEVANFGAKPSEQRGVVRFSTLLQPQSRIHHQDESELQHNTLFLSVPVLKSPEQAVSVTSKYHWLKANPKQEELANLYDTQFGVQYTRATPENKLWTGAVSYGSASDEPFADESVSTIGVTAAHVAPVDETSSWIYLLNYSNNRTFLNNIPLPGIAYSYSPSKQFRGLLGVPFANWFWKFSERWSWSGFTLLPWTYKTQLSYSVAGPLLAYVGADTYQSAYLEQKRTNRRERLYYEEKKMFLGLRSPVSAQLFLELEAGHAFNRRLFRAESFTLRPEAPIELSSSWYGRFSLSALF